jgi:glycosyltransferase involved in cell wall biosynthesis
VLPNPIDAEEIRRVASASSSGGRRFRVCAAGRLVWEKGFDVLLEGFALACNEMGQPCELLVLGEGPRRQELNERARALAIHDQVCFAGFVDNPYPVLASADVFVHPARWEGFGVVVAEAMALGVPIIATACPGGPKDILDGGRAGILVPPEHPQELAHALVRVLQDFAFRTRLASLAKERVEAYRPAAVAETIVEHATRFSEIPLGEKSSLALTGRSVI